MKKILFQILILIPMLSYSSDIELDMSYQMAGITHTEYIISGNGEQCSVTYDEDNSITNTTCLSITNSKGIKILCTQKKKMCKTEQELLDFISPSNNNIEVLDHWVNAHNTQDMNQLKNLYSKEITYYGKKLPRNKCIKDKKRVLGKHPQFKIRTRNIEYISITPTITKITFDKYVKFSPHKQEKMYPSYLLVDLASNVILVEGDAVTDKNIKKKKVTYVTTKGTKFTSKVNKHGAVLQSKSFTIYLGKDCDVSSPQFGEGTWERDKGGFYLTFTEGKHITFQNQRAPTGECWWLDSQPKQETTRGYKALDQNLDQASLMKEAERRHATECEKIISFSELTSLNPYTIKGTCTYQAYIINRVRSANKATGHLSVKRPVSYTDLSQWHSTIDENHPATIEADIRLSKHFSIGYKARGLFKVLGISGKRMQLKWLEEIKN